MIDTVKIAVPYDKRPDWLDIRRWETKRLTGGVFTATMHPSKSYKLAGIYLPRLQYVERPATKTREKTYTLNIELSLPKLHFGNNFDELTDDLFPAIINELSEKLRTVYAVPILPVQLQQAVVSRIDYSKNVIFTDRTPVSTLINSLKTANISKVYDVQHTDFRNGGLIYHIHTNSSDVVAYDKVADLKQAQVSERRSIENDNHSQLNLVEEFDKHKDVTVFRFEVRLSTRQKVRRELKAIGADDDVRFSSLFSTGISRKILLLNWQNIFNRIQVGEVVGDTASQILIAYKQSNPDMKFAEASAVTLMQLLRHELYEERAVRNVIEGLFGTAQYYRLKNKSRDPPDKSQLKDLLYIQKTLTAMKPVSVADFIQ